MHRRNVIAGLGAVGTTSIFGPARAAPDPRPRSYALLGQEAPPFALPRLGEGQASRADSAGRALILCFGGLWCPDCIVDGANIARLALAAETDPAVDFLYIHAFNGFGRWGQSSRSPDYNAERSASALRAYFRETGYSYPVVFDASGDVSSAYALEWFPTFLAIDGAGVIRAWRTDLGSAENADAFFAQARSFANS